MPSLDVGVPGQTSSSRANVEFPGKRRVPGGSSSSVNVFQTSGPRAPPGPSAFDPPVLGDPTIARGPDVCPGTPTFARELRRLPGNRANVGFPGNVDVPGQTSGSRANVGFPGRRRGSRANVGQCSPGNRAGPRAIVGSPGNAGYLSVCLKRRFDYSRAILLTDPDQTLALCLTSSSGDGSSSSGQTSWVGVPNSASKKNKRKRPIETRHRPQKRNSAAPNHGQT